MAPVHVKDDNFQKEVIDHKGLVLVDFWAEWCGPCHMLAPIIEEISEDAKDYLKVAKLDTDANPQTSQKYQIMSIPSVFLFKDGEVVERWVGVQPKSNFMELIEKHK